MKVYIDLQSSSSRNLKYRVRIKNREFEKTVGYFKTATEAIEVKRIVDKTIRILESI